MVADGLFFFAFSHIRIKIELCFYFIFSCTDFVDFLMQSSDNAEATEFIQENPQNENLPSSPLYDQQGDISSWLYFTLAI